MAREAPTVVRKRRDRAPNLDVARVAAIVRVVERLPGRPTWNAVLEAVEREFGVAYTRQTLHAHKAIGSAVRLRKGGEPARPGERRVSEAPRRALDRAAALQAELDVRRRVEDALYERIARLQYNGRANRIPEGTLLQPLPKNFRNG